MEEYETSNRSTVGLRHDASAFSSNILAHLMEEKGPKQNLVTAPARVQAMLALLANWAADDIRQQIVHVATPHACSLTEANQFSKDSNIRLLPLYDNEWGKQAVPVIEGHTTLWYDRQLSVQESAIDAVKAYFPTNVIPVDFSNDTETKKRIDRDVCQGTHGLIPGIDAKIKADTMAMLVDVLYMKAKWEREFYEENTSDRMFYGTDKAHKVPTMHRIAYMQYAEDDICQTVTLPYRCISKNEEQIAMRIFLPVKRHTVHEVLARNSKQVITLPNRTCEVNLALPRFKVEAKVNMKETLCAMGLADLFASNNVIPLCIKDMKISDIMQQTKLEVNEQGTEAASMTAAIIEAGCCPPMEKPKPVIMKVNRPFLFDVVEEKTGTILFAGIVNNIE